MLNKIKVLFSAIVVLLFLISAGAYSQKVKVPRFQITRTNGNLFRAQDLPMDKPIIIIYFSPDCEECQRFTEAMLLKKDNFQNASIVMITYQPVQNVVQFVARYKLDIYPNIFVGTEGSTFIVRYYYNITRFPFVALYSRNGDLVKIWDKNEDIDDLSNHLKNL